VNSAGIAVFKVQLDLQVILEMILRVWWANQQCHGIEGQWL